MATAAELASLRERIANILTTDPCQRIQFNVPGFSFRPGAFMVIGVSLKFSDAAHRVPGYRGRPMHVSVVRMPANTGAMYHAHSNSIAVPHASFGATPWERQALVHESVHAVFDYQRVRLAAFQEEACAYIAGSMFRRLTGTIEAGATGIDAAADLISIDLCITGAGSRGLSPWTSDVTAAQMQTLIAEIRRSPTYRGLRSERAGFRYAHDGGTL